MREGGDSTRDNGRWQQEGRQRKVEVSQVTQGVSSQGSALGWRDGPEEEQQDMMLFEKGKIRLVD